MSRSHWGPKPRFSVLKELPSESRMVGDMAADAFCVPRRLQGKAPEEKGLPGISLRTPPPHQFVASFLVARGVRSRGSYP